nr:hypothetical protein [uncultured Dysosmobacter sp.]
MKLHTHPEEFRELITVVANEKHIPESAVERDYYIVMMLKALADSPYADRCVFKGALLSANATQAPLTGSLRTLTLPFLGWSYQTMPATKPSRKSKTSCPSAPCHLQHTGPQGALHLRCNPPVPDAGDSDIPF